MLRHLRLIGLIALLLALPLRGYAAGAMLFCGGAHGLDASATAAAHAHASAAPHGENAGHGGHGAAHDASTGHGDDDGTQAPAGTHDTPSGCGICGACCTGVASAPMPPQVEAAAPAALPIPFAPPLYRGVDLARDERPPLA